MVNSISFLLVVEVLLSLREWIPPPPKKIEDIWKKGGNMLLWKK